MLCSSARHGRIPAPDKVEILHAEVLVARSPVTLTNLFLVAEAATPAQTPQAADDMAYYAVHGALPSGATLPALAHLGYSCLGTAS